MDQAALHSSPPNLTSRRVSNAAPLALAGVAAVSVALGQRQGVGDDLLDAAALGITATLSAVVALVYTRFEHDGARAARVRLVAWTVIRYFVAFEMMRYGTAKLVGMQFYPRYYRLDSRVIDLPPSALAWSFFGGSYAYQAFTGVAEIAAALLVCFRRTATLGACLLVAVMTNVVLVNFAYDIHVKLFSSTLLVMGLYLIALDRNRLWTVFVGDGPVPPRHYAASPEQPRGKRLWALHGLALLVVFGGSTADVLHHAEQHRVFSQEALEGAWDIDKRIGLDDLIPEARGSWDKVYFEKGDYGFVRAGKQRVRFDVSVDESASTLRLSKLGGHDSSVLDATFQRSDRGVHVEGSRDGKPFSFDLTRDFPR